MTVSKTFSVVFEDEHLQFHEMKNGHFLCVFTCVYMSASFKAVVHICLYHFPLHHLLRHSKQRKYLKISCVENWPFVFDILQIACHLGMAPNICENSTKKIVIFILIQPLPHKNSLKKDQSFSLMGTTLSLCLKPFKSQSTVLTDFQSLTTEGWQKQCIHISTLSPETTGNVGDGSLAPSPDLISESFSTLCPRKPPRVCVLSHVWLFVTLWTIA